MPTKDPVDFGQLADSYEILGALAGREDAEVVLATRKADRLPVLIVVTREPREDAGNALSHLASDAQLLSGRAHPGVVPVLESRWLGDDTLAIVTERVSAPSLAERLSRREEAFPFPRIAAVLRELNGILEWARERRIVHRTLRPDTVFVEEGSDAVRVLFVARSLSVNGVPDDRDDARTIAALARAMMTRSVADPERDQQPLAELRSGLPSRVVQQTEALMGRAESLEPVDVRAYISAIAMAEELRKGEEECERITREMDEEQRVTREQLAAERKAHEEDLAEQARKFEAEREQILKDMAREREDAARAVSRERESAEKQLRKEREQLEKEMQKQRELLAKERAKLSRERKSFEAEQEKQRAAIAEKLAALTAQAELYGRTTEMPAALATPFPEPTIAPPVEDDGVTGDEIVEDDDSVVVDEIVDEPEDAPVLAAAESGRRPPLATGSWHSRFAVDKGWRRTGVVAVALLLVAVIGALALGRRGNGERAPTALLTQTTPDLRVVDSVSGLAVPDSVTDSVSVTVETADPAPRQRRTTTPRPRPARRDTLSRPNPDTIVPIPDPFSPAVPPPVVTPLPPIRTDSVTRRDTSVRRDTLVRADTSSRVILAPPTLPDSGAFRRTPR